MSCIRCDAWESVFSKHAERWGNLAMESAGRISAAETENKRLRAELAEARAFAVAEHGAWQTMNDRIAIAEERNAAACYALTGGNPSLDGTASARLVMEVLRVLRALDGGTE